MAVVKAARHLSELEVKAQLILAGLLAPIMLADLSGDENFLRYRTPPGTSIEMASKAAATFQARIVEVFRLIKRVDVTTDASCIDGMTSSVTKDGDSICVDVVFSSKLNAFHTREIADKACRILGRSAHLSVGRKYDVGGKIWTYPSHPDGTSWIETAVAVMASGGNLFDKIEEGERTYALIYSAERIPLQTREIYRNTASNEEEFFFKANKPSTKYTEEAIAKVYMVVDGKGIWEDSYMTGFSSGWNSIGFERVGVL